MGRGGVFHATSDQDRAYSAVRVDKDRKFPSSICAKSRPLPPDRPAEKMTSVASLDGRKTKTVALRTTMNPIWCVCDTRLRLRSQLCDGGLQDLDGSLARSSLTSFER